MTNISGCEWPQFAAQLLQIRHKYQVWGKPLIHAMDFASVERFSVTYLGLYLARKLETQQTYEILHHVITFLKSVAETSSACPKEGGGGTPL